jgi:hypothetical protein
VDAGRATTFRLQMRAPLRSAHIDHSVHCYLLFRAPRVPWLNPKQARLCPQAVELCHSGRGVGGTARGRTRSACSGPAQPQRGMRAECPSWPRTLRRVEVERAAELNVRGMSLSEVATDLGVSPDSVRRHLRRAGGPMRPVGRPGAGTGPRPRLRRWREILADALARQEAISVPGTVTSHLRRTPSGAEITAARSRRPQSPALSQRLQRRLST